MTGLYLPSGAEGGKEERSECLHLEEEIGVSVEQEMFLDMVVLFLVMNVVVLVLMNSSVEGKVSSPLYTRLDAVDPHPK